MATQEKNLSYHLSKMLHGNADESANLDKENNRQGLKMVASEDTDNVSFFKRFLKIKVRYIFSFIYKIYFFAI